jgi:hypothetical protein
MGTVCTALLTTVGTSFLILEGPAGSCVAVGLVLIFLGPTGYCVAVGLVLSLVEPAGSCVAAGSVLTSKGEGVGVAPGSGT